MFWQEKDDDKFVLNDDVVDVIFELKGTVVPIDHGYVLARELIRQIPWFEHEAQCGLHQIHVAASGNGWERPEADQQGTMYISRRTKLVLRLPKPRIAEAMNVLEGAELDLDGCVLTVGKSKTRPLSTLTTLFSRYVIADSPQDEGAFTRHVVAQLRDLDIRVRKLMCGKSSVLRTPDGDLHVRSVMLADLDVDESVRLQQHGIGPGRHLGCGLFIPHKGIEAVSSKQSDGHKD
ncbi:MAG: type I-MYXAN CRISPR-associated protein Cas6/Cmx6 [Gammaproteobacteria bacterium]|nr:type I-MYXAN CRISPR-associated protein Cas6/Cmx6 [Gammaproteobacteria bacterium]MCP5135886.1 type I-MYXAN CRISPR-associated protein Cas6/Cmx6 [Gammaproteobacteria bacterium]